MSFPSFADTHYINKNTKIDEQGVVIICPCCAAEERIYSLDWATRRCSTCNQLEARGDYLVKPEEDSR